MKTLGNILWFILGGWLAGLLWYFVGLIWCITIVGIPVGLQCFKFGTMAFFPFGKNITFGGGAGSTILNIFWLIFGGLELAVTFAVYGLVLCVTIIGIPFGLQYFKFAKLALFPFGAKVSKQIPA